MSLLRISKNKEKIVKLLNANIDLQYKIDLKSFKKIYEKQIDIGPKRHPKIVTATLGMWYEYYKDESEPNSKPLRLERNKIIAINGQPSDGWRLIEYYTVDNL